MALTKYANSALRAQAKTKVYSLHILTRQLADLDQLRREIGISAAEQIRRGIDLWIAKQRRAVK